MPEGRDPSVAADEQSLGTPAAPLRHHPDQGPVGQVPVLLGDRRGGRGVDAEQSAPDLGGVQIPVAHVHALGADDLAAALPALVSAVGPARHRVLATPGQARGEGCPFGRQQVVVGRKCPHVAPGAQQHPPGRIDIGGRRGGGAHERGARCRSGDPGGDLRAGCRVEVDEVAAARLRERALHRGRGRRGGRIAGAGCEAGAGDEGECEDQARVAHLAALLVCWCHLYNALFLSYVNYLVAGCGKTR